MVGKYVPVEFVEGDQAEPRMREAEQRRQAEDVAQRKTINGIKCIQQPRVLLYMNILIGQTVSRQPKATNSKAPPNFRGRKKNTAIYTYVASRVRKQASIVQPPRNPNTLHNTTLQLEI